MYDRNYILDLIDQFCGDDQNRIAFKLYDGSQITDICYRDFAEATLGAAGFFQEKGIVNSHIALIGANSFEWIIVFFGIVASGNVAVLMNPELSRELLLHQCRQADVSLVCGEESVVSELTESIPCFSFDEMKKMGQIGFGSRVLAVPDDTSVLLFTSGTTGESKIAQISYKNMDSSIRSADGVFSAPGIDKVMTALPFFHIAGLRGTLAMLHRYKTLCIGRGARYLFQDMAVFSPSYVLLVPMIVESIVKIIRNTSEKEAQQKYLGTNLKRICVGGATVDPMVCRFLMEKGFIIDSGYAMTETTGVGTWGQWDEKHFNTIGKLSCELQCRIADGELLFKGPAVMKGYYKDPEATSAVIEDGWLHSGDLGFCDEDGYYYLTGRKKQLIVMPNGEKINPEELENHLRACDAILECLVYLEGKQLCADIYADDSVAAERFIEAYNSDTPLAYHIHKIIFHEEPLRKTASGKLIRKENTQ